MSKKRQLENNESTNSSVKSVTDENADKNIAYEVSAVVSTYVDAGGECPKEHDPGWISKHIKRTKGSSVSSSEVRRAVAKYNNAIALAASYLSNNTMFIRHNSKPAKPATGILKMR